MEISEHSDSRWIRFHIYFPNKASQTPNKASFTSIHLPGATSALGSVSFSSLYNTMHKRMPAVVEALRTFECGY